MANWIPFHEDLTRGKYRGVPRAARFVFLELALLARPGRGAIDLPLGMGDLDGVIDLLGGNRDEVARALEVFTTGSDPALVFEGPEGARRLRIPGWERRNGTSREAAGSSTKRVQALRERRRGSDVTLDVTAGVTAGVTHDDPLHVTADVTHVTALQDSTGQNNTNTPSGCESARTHAHARGPVEPLAGGTRAPTTDDLAAELRRYPTLAPLAADETYLGALTMALATTGASADAMREAVSEFALKNARSARGLDLDSLSTKLGGYLAAAKRRTQDRGGGVVTGQAVDPAVRRVLDGFRASWGRQKGGRKYPVADGDLGAAQRLVESARGNALDLDPDVGTEDIVGHWVRGYLADTDRFIADRDHPLALLPARVSSYGLPGRAKPKPPEDAPAPSSPPPPPSEIAAGAAGTLAHLRRVGEGGTGSIVPRVRASA